MVICLSTPLSSMMNNPLNKKIKRFFKNHVKITSNIGNILVFYEFFPTNICPVIDF